tara:strand:+ start:126 stop:416 length:291 start_codon:yes stop_codon:yes gene_type:complete
VVAVDNEAEYERITNTITLQRTTRSAAIIAIEMVLVFSLYNHLRRLQARIQKDLLQRRMKWQQRDELEVQKDLFPLFPLTSESIETKVDAQPFANV